MSAPELEVIAHRGYSAVAPENTLAALERALSAGADALEWDTQVSADGVPVLLHDEMLDRTTNGLGPVSLLPLRELEQLDAGSWFAPGFTGERVPTLRSALALASGRCERVYPEIKGYRTLRDMEGVVGAIEAEGWSAGAVVISLDWDAVRRVRSLTWDVSVGFIVEAAERFEPALDEAVELKEQSGDAGAAMVDCDYTLLLGRPERVRAAAEREVELAVWTVDDPEDARRLLELGVGRITTNQVERILALR